MTDQNNNSPPNGPTSRRRSSFAGQAFADLFGSRNRSTSITESNNSPPGPSGQFGSGPITAAAAQANQRRLSLSTIGLANSPPTSGGYFGNRGRGDSVSSSNNVSVDESAVDEEPASAGTSQPTTPFARRVSFGARALRDVKGGGNNGTNEAGFNWADNMRTRAERTSVGGANMMGTSPTTGMHHRAKSVAVMEQPVREAPRPVRTLDHTQERILKGDFYMD